VQWMSLVEDTKWLSHLRLILSASWETAYWVHVHRVPVFVHCSHGWDRTSQVVALAQLLVDPHYRTLEGFSTLVEKDFMSFGHPFHTRCSHGEGRGENPSGNDDGQISPIFIQFLDAVFQIVNQYPEAFEFNTKYLLVLSENVYSCRFGTLLCDTERERELIAGIRQRTHSIWDYLEARTDVRNASFKAGGILLMPLPSLLRNITLWVDRHCMYGPKPTLRLLDVVRPVDPLATDQQANFYCEKDAFTLMSSSNVGF
jgi:myotubularin-related protein 1/2